MSIANENNRESITASAAQTIFPYSFKIDDESEIEVFLTPVGDTPDDAGDLLTLTTHYTVSGVGNDSGGNVTLVSAATLNDTVTMLRDIPYQQDKVLNVGQDNAVNLESGLDRLAMMMQQLKETISRCYKTQKTGNIPTTELIYEEGTWTPVLSDGTNADATQTINIGTYTKIGRLVHVKGRLVISSLGSVSGALRITGLPFAANSTAHTHGVGSVGLTGGLAITAGYALATYIIPGESYLQPVIWDNTEGTTALTSAELSADGDLIFDLTYYV